MLEPTERTALFFLLGLLNWEAVDLVLLGLAGLPVYRVRSSQAMKGGTALDRLELLDPAIPEALPLPGLFSPESVNSPCFGYSSFELGLRCLQCSELTWNCF